MSKSLKIREIRGKVDGGADRDRTGDLLTASQALSQLSYSPTRGSVILQEDHGSVKKGSIAYAADIGYTDSCPSQGATQKERTMDKNRLSSAQMQRLRRREAELLARIEKMRQRMNETKDLDTLAFKSKLYKEAQDELRRIHDKLAGRGSEE